MWVAAAEATSDGNMSVPTVLLLIAIVGVFSYSFGYLRARLHAANNAYKGTKAAVKPARKTFWVAWWATLRLGMLGVFGLIAAALLVAWV